MATESDDFEKYSPNEEAEFQRWKQSLIDSEMSPFAEPANFEIPQELFKPRWPLLTKIKIKTDQFVDKAAETLDADYVKTLGVLAGITAGAFSFGFGYSPDVIAKNILVGGLLGAGIGVIIEQKRRHSSGSN